MPASPNTKEIILNCMPPSTVGSPSAALSILKAYLCKHGYSVRIIYWNILLHNLENEFTWNKCQNVQGASTLIYAAYLAVKNNNKSLYNEVKAALQTILPVMLNEKGFFDEHIEKYALKLEQFIDSYLDSIDFKNVLYFGFPVNMNQWILASVLAEKIKKRAPNIPIVIGGITTDEIAKVFLENFKQFDIAFWGEDEVHFAELTRFLSNSNNFSEFNAVRFYYRENDMVKKSVISKYFKDILTKKQEYISKINLYHKAFNDVFDEESKWHFFEYSLNHRDEKWGYFNDLHFHYIHNRYNYKFKRENNKIIYREFLNNEMTEHIEFDKNELYIPILNYCYDKPISIHELHELHTKENINCSYSIDDIIEKIDTLFHQGLLYRTTDYSEIVSIVNVKNQEL